MPRGLVLALNTLHSSAITKHVITFKCRKLY